MASAENKLRARWCRVGFRFACTADQAPVDPEALLAESAVMGRTDPDVLWAAISWMVSFGDLVNIPRLSRLTSDGALMGAISEIALAHGADKRFRQVADRNTPNPSPQILFAVMEKSPALSRREIESPHPIFLKWGYYCSSVTFKTDALNNRQYVLSRNANLALRAVFGPHARAEILWALMQVSHQTISGLARAVGLSYQPVYAEIDDMVRNGLLTCQTWGRTRVVGLTASTAAFLRALPGASAG